MLGIDTVAPSGTLMGDGEGEGSKAAIESAKLCKSTSS